MVCIYRRVELESKKNATTKQRVPSSTQFLEKRYYIDAFPRSLSSSLCEGKISPSSEASLAFSIHTHIRAQEQCIRFSLTLACISPAKQKLTVPLTSDAFIRILTLSKLSAAPMRVSSASLHACMHIPPSTSQPLLLPSISSSAKRDVFSECVFAKWASDIDRSAPRRGTN